MLLKGRAWKFGDDVDTDAIIPARYLNTSDPSELARHVMEDADPAFASRVKKGDIMVAGKDFGLGSSREHAPLVIKLAGVSAVLAKSFARIFFRNAINQGLPVLLCDTDKIAPNDELEINFAANTVTDLTSGHKLSFSKIPPVMLNILDEGGLIPYIKKYGDFKL